MLLSRHSNIEEHNRRTVLERSVIYIWDKGGLKLVLLDLRPGPKLTQGFDTVTFWSA